MKLTILGCHAATPRNLFNPTSQVLEMAGQLFLIDCAEATQTQLRRYKIKFFAINHVFISHLHGDHFYGLPGLLTTYNLLGRTAPLHIYAPEGARQAMETLLQVSQVELKYDLHFTDLKSPEHQLIFENDKLEVYTLPLKHRIYANGFLFREKPLPRKLNIEAVNRLGVNTCYFQLLKAGQGLSLPDGRKIPNSELTFDPEPPKSYAFCSDTAYSEALCPLIKGADWLYHESTFLEEHAALAGITGHSTAAQAAQIAREAQVKKLILGHYSTRYESTDAFKTEAERIFPHVELSQDGKVFEY